MARKKVTKKQNSTVLDYIKKNIVLITSLIIFIIVFGFVMYTGGEQAQELDSDNPLDVANGSKMVAERLEKIIPYSAINDLKYQTAYQKNKTTAEDIANDIFLQMAYNNSEEKTYTAFQTTLTRLYGDNLFIMNHDFNINGQVKCTSSNALNQYNCEDTTADGPIYDIIADYTKLNIENDIYYLTQEVYFYSKEETDDGVTYTLYFDYQYQNVVAKFTDKDLNNQDVASFIKTKYAGYKSTYLSKFDLNKNSYRWLSTERIKNNETK